MFARNSINIKERSEAARGGGSDHVQCHEINIYSGSISIFAIKARRMAPAEIRGGSKLFEFSVYWRAQVSIGNSSGKISVFTRKAPPVHREG